MQVQPYLFFEGRCDEAIEFYKKALGAQVGMLMRFKECPDPQATAHLPPGGENKVMHASLTIGTSTFFASDGHCGGTTKFGGFSLSLSVINDDEASQKFTALADGGKVTWPLAKTFFASKFGMLTDRFGVSWQVMVAK